MANKPGQEKENFGFSFPFRCWDSTLTDFIYPTHWHEYYEVFVVLQGKVNVVIDGDTQEACQGDIVFLDPGRVHSFPSSDPGTCLRLIHFEQRIFAKEDHISALIDNGMIFAQKPIIRAVPNAGKDTYDDVLYTKIYGIVEQIFNEYKKKDKGWQIAIKAGLYFMFLTHVRGSMAENAGKISKRLLPITTEERFEQVSLLISKHFHDADLNLNRAAQEAALSRFHFVRFFKQKTGRTFYTFLSSVRLSHARDLLLKTDLPIIDIARESGFASLSTFFRVFKAGTGYTPSQYREIKKQ
jgi:AraC-like DNA-binding protein/mannose-6-phosphate isomerase-like protein (cupin superfamily)